MNLRTLTLLALAVCLMPAAAQKKKNKADAKKPAQTQYTIPAVTAQPVSSDKFSYAMGLMQGPSLEQFLVQQQGVDTAYMAQVAEGLKSTISEKEAKQIIAFAAGLRIAEMNRERVIGSLNEQFTGKADTTYVNATDFTNGLVASLTKDKNAISADSAQKVVEQQNDYRQQTWKADNVKWLIENLKRDGVKTTESGLQYRILTQGTGPMASDTSNVEVHYEGKLINGKVFDSSYKRGKTTKFPVNGVIKGWQEALLMMPEGSSWEVFVPQEIGYGERGAGRDIPANSTLIFKVDLIKVNAPK